MGKEVNLVDLYESVCGASCWVDAMKGVVRALGEVSGLLSWMSRLEEANEDRELTLSVLRAYAVEAGWQVTGNRASHRVAPESELEALREENLRLKQNLESLSKQLRDVPPPGTKERLAEVLEKLQTETLRSAHLYRIIDTMHAQEALEAAQRNLIEARNNEKASEKAYYGALNRGGKGGLESAVLAADQDLEA